MVGEQPSWRQVILVGVCAVATVVLSVSGCSSDGRSGGATTAEPARPMATVTAAIEVGSDVTVPVPTSTTRAAVAQAPGATRAATTAEARPETVPLEFDARVVSREGANFLEVAVTGPAPPGAEFLVVYFDGRLRAVSTLNRGSVRGLNLGPPNGAAQVEVSVAAESAIGEELARGGPLTLERPDAGLPPPPTHRPPPGLPEPTPGVLAEHTFDGVRPAGAEPPGLAFESRLVETPEGLYVEIDSLLAPPPGTASWVMDIELGPTHVVPAVPDASLRVPADGFGPPGVQVNRIWYTLTARSSSGDILASGTDIFELPRNR